MGTKKAVLLVAALAAAGVLGYHWLLPCKQALCQEARSFTDETVQAVGRAWDPTQLSGRACHEFNDSMTEDQLASKFADFREALGPLRRWDGCTGSVTVHSTLTGQTAKAEYSGEGVFANGTARITVKTIHRDNAWQVVHFAVDSPLLGE